MNFAPFVCGNFLATCRDANRCHICLQPRNVHPTDADSPGYWANWLIGRVLTELAPRD